MSVYSGLMYSMYKYCLQHVKSHQADVLVDAKFVYDYHEDRGEWPALFYVYYRANATELYLPGVTKANGIRYGHNVDSQGALVKYVLENGTYESYEISREEMEREIESHDAVSSKA